MKAFIFFLSFLFYSTLSFGQTATVDYRINGVLNPTKLSISDKNVVVIEGNGCENYTLVGKNMAISKTAAGYIFVTGKKAKTATLIINCVSNGQTTVLRRVEFKLVR